MTYWIQFLFLTDLRGARVIEWFERIRNKHRSLPKLDDVCVGPFLRDTSPGQGGAKMSMVVRECTPTIFGVSMVGFWIYCSS